MRSTFFVLLVTLLAGKALHLGTNPEMTPRLAATSQAYAQLAKNASDVKPRNIRPKSVSIGAVVFGQTGRTLGGAVYGIASSRRGGGVHGESAHSATDSATNSTNNGAGVLGEPPRQDTVAVRGNINAGSGRDILGISTGWSGFGVMGDARSTQGRYGVYGRSLGSQSAEYGVSGTSHEARSDANLATRSIYGVTQNF